MKMMNRNLAVVACALVALAVVTPASAQIPMDPATIPKFVNELPLLGPTGLPVLDGTTPSMISICEFQTEILPVGTFTAGQTPKTWVWGYQIGDTCLQNPGHSYIGPVVVAQRGTRTQMTFINQLGDTSNSSVRAYTENVDQTMHWADPLNYGDNFCSEYLSMYGGAPAPGCELTYQGPIPAAVHLHGGEIPPDLDGGPDSWWTQNGAYQGHGFYTREVGDISTIPMENPDFPAGVLVRNLADDTYYRSEGATWTANAPIDRATYVYPNTQEAANIWFHDHVLGATRINVYAGIAGAYVITDPAATNPDLGPVTNLVPLVIQDRQFDTDGELFFAQAPTTDEHPFWVAEFLGDVAVVNGAAWPTMTVEPKRYRFLFLNGSNSRAYELFMVEPGQLLKNGKIGDDLPGPMMWVIGTDGGYLDAPVKLNPDAGNGTLQPANTKDIYKLVLLPGERYEVIMDFSKFAGKTLEMRNTAFNPYPFGPVPPIPQIIQFQVGTAVTNDGMGVAYDPAAYKKKDPTTSPRVDPIVPLAPLAAAPDVRRQLTLNEVGSPISGAPLEALLNNTKWNGLQVDESTPVPHVPEPRGDFTLVPTYTDPTYYSELPGEGTMEVWEIINITADAHPIHLHLVQFQILERQPIDPLCYLTIYDAAFPGGVYLPGFGPPADYNTGVNDNGVQIATLGVLGGNPDPAPCYVGAARKPDKYEAGWKDTVVMYPDEVTKIAVRFAPTDIPNTVTDITALGYPFDPNHGHGYVWHCHILDHEDNEMMRPTQVNTNTLFPPANRGFVKGIDY